MVLGREHHRVRVWTGSLFRINSRGTSLGHGIVSKWLHETALSDRLPPEARTCVHLGVQDRRVYGVSDRALRPQDERTMNRGPGE